MENLKIKILRKIPLVLAWIFLVCQTSQVFAQSEGDVGYSFTQGDLTYTVREVTASSPLYGVRGYNTIGEKYLSVRATSSSIAGDEGFLHIPYNFTINDDYINVEEVEAEGFKDCVNIKEIKAGGQTVGPYLYGNDCFKGCTSLNTISFATIDLMYFADDNGDVFEGCTSLTAIKATLWCGNLEYMIGDRDFYLTRWNSMTDVEETSILFTTRDVYHDDMNLLVYSIKDGTDKTAYVDFDGEIAYVMGWPPEPYTEIKSQVTINGEQYTVVDFAQGVNSFDADFPYDGTVHTLKIPNTISNIRGDNLPRTGKMEYLLDASHPTCTTINGSIYSKENLNTLLVASNAMEEIPANVEIIAPYAFYNFNIGAAYGSDNKVRLNHNIKEVQENGFKYFWGDLIISDGASLPLKNLTSNLYDSGEGFVDMGVYVEKTLPVDEWSLIGSSLFALYEDLDFNKGTSTGIAHSMAAVPFDHANNSWGDYVTDKHYDRELANELFESVMIYPVKKELDKGDESPDLDDEEIVLSFGRYGTYLKEGRDENVNLTSQNSGHWYPLANPYIGKLNLNNFYDRNESVINSKYFWIWKDGDWEALSLADNTYAIYPATGFIVDLATISGSESLTFSPSDIDTDSDVITKSSPVDKLSFRVSNNGVAKEMFAHIDDNSSNSYGKLDAAIMFSDNEDAVNPYFLVDNRAIFDNYFSSLPATFDVNFNSYKNNTVDFELASGLENIEVSLIDLENNSAEHVLNVGEPVSISLTQGDNYGRYQIRFTKKNVGITELASGDTEIDIYNSSRDIFVNGNSMQRVEIYNTLGQMVYTQRLSGESVKISTDLKDGAYMVKVYADKGTKTQKIIVK